jgi:hypothetical protein
MLVEGMLRGMMTRAMELDGRMTREGRGNADGSDESKAVLTSWK